jgi:hypothetical protein
MMKVGRLRVRLREPSVKRTAGMLVTSRANSEPTLTMSMNTRSTGPTDRTRRFKKNSRKGVSLMVYAQTINGWKKAGKETPKRSRAGLPRAATTAQINNKPPR